MTTLRPNVFAWIAAGLSMAATLMAALGGTSPLRAFEPVEHVDTAQRALRWTAASGRTVEVSNINGPIHVVAYDGATVEVSARRTVRADTVEDADVAARRIQMAFQEGADTISICADAEQCGCRRENWSRHDDSRPRYRIDVEFDLKVPRAAAVTACTINRGEVTMEDVGGGFEARNVNGRIELTRMHGSGFAITVNGDITANFAQSPRSASAFKTVNGDIDVRFPSDLSADLRMTTMNGGLYTDFDVTSLPAAPATERRGARFVYRSDRFATVRVGQGGPELTFEGLNSSIRVLRSAR